jgi:hypothetical protein
LPNFLRTFSRTSIPPTHEPMSTVKDRPASGSKNRTSLRRRSSREGVPGLGLGLKGPRPTAKDGGDGVPAGLMDWLKVSSIGERL